VKKLNEILFGVSLTETVGSTAIGISSVEFDSRKINEGALFVAVRGTRADGHDYIEQAIKQGAAAIICEAIPAYRAPEITYIMVSDSRRALGIIASNFYDNPSEELVLVGVTGTNGTTTIVTLLFQLFRHLGFGTAMLSTIRNQIDRRVIEATHTTPDPIQVNELLRAAVEEGCDYVFMEVSSHAIEQERIAGLVFNGGVFTNITHEHLDYHPTFNDYLAAKKRFFDGLPAHAFALSNTDDKNGKVILQNTRARKYTYGLSGISDFNAKIVESHLDGMLLKLDGTELWTRLAGRFNACNLLAVYAVARILGIDASQVMTHLSSLEPAEGRFNMLKSEHDVTAIIDYAHTPDALKNVLETISALRTKNEHVITVIGAGGDRDREKRPLMAKIACVGSDKVILTSDNPRTEDPGQIIKDMEQGIDPVEARKVITVPDRKEAIKTACAIARSHDIILVAGKGHEKYQEIKGVKHPFDDRKVLMEFLEINNKH
jgi:UDP-N-acetylmuramoyl-L-alanyl-D-glutamate--2,6-diaminopimelate ligase